MTDEELDTVLDAGESGKGDPDDQRIDKLLKDARTEAAKRRIQNRELTATLEQLKADLDATRAQADEYRQKWETDTQVLERERLERQAILDGITAANKAVIDGLPEKLRTKVVPTGLPPLELRQWLDAAVPELLKQVAPTDGAAGSVADRGNQQMPVDADAAALAKMLNIDPQALVKNVRKREVS